MPLKLSRYKVWILAPHLITNDSNIDYYYDYSQSIEEYKKVFTELQIEWEWQPVTLKDYKPVIDKIANFNQKNNQLVLNLCDGDEINDTPGISVIHYLEQKGICYTGADAFFYDITTSKIPMKLAFNQHAVPTAVWRSIKNDAVDLSTIFEELGTPIILKPAVSGGSMGIGIKNVVSNIDDCQEQILKMQTGYRGWSLTGDGIIAESFIEGPEFTVFITGNHDCAERATIFTPVERLFHDSLPENEKFLSFDRLWEIYDEETPMPNDEFFYEYQQPDKFLINSIKKLSWDAFVACKGTGYARVDIRMDRHTQKMYVLEVNAQCGISEDEDFTSIGAILRFSNTSFTNLIASILKETISRKILMPIPS
jgi:D-alanine-D-alanine ligase